MSSQAEANSKALARVRELCPLIREQAASVELAGSLTSMMIGAFRDAELFWITVPEDLGGGGADIVTGLQAIEELSRADGSIGWSLMANSCAVTNAAGFLPASAVDRMFADGPPIVAGMLAPRGTAVPSGDGFTISGSYQFGSGISHADWIGGGVFVREDESVELPQWPGQCLEIVAVPDVASPSDRFAASPADPGRYLLAGIHLSARHDDLCAVLRHSLGDGSANTPAGPGDHRHLAGQIEERGHWELLLFVVDTYRFPISRSRCPAYFARRPATSTHTPRPIAAPAIADRRAVG